MSKVLFIFISGVIAVGMCVFIWVNSKTKHLPVLKVMTYPSFLSPYGPARDIQNQFEQKCDCQIQWIRVEDSTAIASRLHLRSDGMEIDIALGFDQLTLSAVYSAWKWKKIEIDQQHAFLPITKKWIHYQSQISKKNLLWAVPISWSPLSFIVKEPTVLNQIHLLNLQKKWKKRISIPDPRYSTLGLQFYFWLFAVVGEKKLFDFLKNFKKQLYSVSHSWSSSYGLFQKGFADMSFSYQTSLIYHQLEEKNKYFSLSFAHGHPYQIEFVAIPNTCKQCNLAQKFVNFLLTSEIQQVLMNKNYMLPVIDKVTYPPAFKELHLPSLISYEKLELFLSKKENWIQKWEFIF